MDILCKLCSGIKLSNKSLQINILMHNIFCVIYKNISRHIFIMGYIGIRHDYEKPLVG